MSQSPYKGFNRETKKDKKDCTKGLNPPIRGSIDAIINYITIGG